MIWRCAASGDRAGQSIAWSKIIPPLIATSGGFPATGGVEKTANEMPRALTVWRSTRGVRGCVRRKATRRSYDVTRSPRLQSLRVFEPLEHVFADVLRPGRHQSVET